MHRLSLKLCLLGVLPLAMGCARASAAETPSAAEAPMKALATVNGVPITAFDLEQRIRQSGHGTSTAKPDDPTVLQTVIDDELVYERGVALGLDRDAAYQRKVAEMEAELATLKRREMAELVYAHDAKQDTEVTDAEAKAFYDRNAERIRTEVHVEQLLYKGDRQGAELALKEIRGGADFDAVAAKRFPPMGGRHPWDLGFLRFEQLPEAWQGVVYALKPGQVSDLVAGEGDRFWIVKLVEKREEPAMTWEAAKPRIVAVLRRDRVGEGRAGMVANLRQHAKIVYGKRAAEQAAGGKAPRD